jgi:hypothetical protein
MPVRKAGEPVLGSTPATGPLEALGRGAATDVPTEGAETCTGLTTPDVPPGGLGTHGTVAVGTHGGLGTHGTVAVGTHGGLGTQGTVSVGTHGGVGTHGTVSVGTHGGVGTHGTVGVGTHPGDGAVRHPVWAGLVRAMPWLVSHS